MNWHGRLSELAFVDRFVDMRSLPSTDLRFDSTRDDFVKQAQAARPAAGAGAARSLPKTADAASARPAPAMPAASTPA